MDLMAASESKREAIEVAARPLRELVREEHDEIAAAQRALRQAEKAHNRAIELAQRQLRAARTRSRWPPMATSWSSTPTG